MTAFHVAIQKFGGPEVLKWTEAPTKPLLEKTVRIRVCAAGVNFADVLMRMGLYPEAPKPPFAPGYEVSGVISELGPGVTEFKIGDEVVSATAFGGYATEVTVPVTLVHLKPKNVSLQDSAGIPVNFATAFIALEEMARVRYGDRVLISSAAGGVGLAAVQMAAAAGAHVVGAVSHSAKATAVRDYGAREVITYPELKNLKSDFDIILDAAGGESLKQGFRLLRPTGRIVSFGVSNMSGGMKRSWIKTAGFLLHTPLYTPFQLMMQNKGVFGLNMLKILDKPEIIRRVFARIVDGFEEGRYKIHIGKTFPLAEAGEAQRFLQSRQNIGKVLLTV